VQQCLPRELQRPRCGWLWRGGLSSLCPAQLPQSAVCVINMLTERYAIGVPVAERQLDEWNAQRRRCVVSMEHDPCMCRISIVPQRPTPSFGHVLYLPPRKGNALSASIACANETACHDFSVAWYRASTGEMAAVCVRCRCLLCVGVGVFCACAG
jgi:hypothetical protein